MDAIRNDRQRNGVAWTRLLLAGCIACAVCGGPVLLSACSSGEPQEPATTETTETAGTTEAEATDTSSQTDDTKSQEPAETDDAEAAAEVAPTATESEAAETTAGEAGETYGSWAAECMDKWNDPTVYAIAELKGWQLETLLQEKGYTWNHEDSCWFDGKTAVTVYDETLTPLDDDAISKLDKGGVGASGVLYRITTPNYPVCSSAYQDMVSKVMVSEDVVYDDNLTVAIGVCYGPSMRRYLVEIVNEDTGVSAFVFTEEAIKKGVITAIMGDDLGTSIDEVFKAITGRTPGSQH